jgi:competence protein ComGC
MKLLIISFLLLILTVPDPSKTNHKATEKSSDGKYDIIVYYTTYFDDKNNCWIVLKDGRKEATGIILDNIHCSKCNKYADNPILLLTFSRDDEIPKCLYTGLKCGHRSVAWFDKVYFD